MTTSPKMSLSLRVTGPVFRPMRTWNFSCSMRMPLYCWIFCWTVIAAIGAFSGCLKTARIPSPIFFTIVPLLL